MRGREALAFQNHRILLLLLGKQMRKEALRENRSPVAIMSAVLLSSKPESVFRRLQTRTNKPSQCLNAACTKYFHYASAFTKRQSTKRRYIFESRFVSSLREFLPAYHARVNKIEKKIFTEHKRLAGTSEIDAKVRYVKLARGLPTFGVHFFLVKVSLDI